MSGSSPADCGSDLVKGVWNVASSTVVETGKNLVSYDYDKIDALYGQDMEAEMAVITGAQALSLGVGGKLIEKSVSIGKQGVKKLSEDTLNDPDNISIDERSGAKIYTKKYDFDISAPIVDGKTSPNTLKSGTNKVIIHPNPSKSTQFPLAPRYIN